ncbi:hypothetical protein ACTXMZ_17880 [Brachybacterium alimentarium]
MVERITVASDAMGGDTVEIAELRAPCGRADMARVAVGSQR